MPVSYIYVPFGFAERHILYCKTGRLAIQNGPFCRPKRPIRYGENDFGKLFSVPGHGRVGIIGKRAFQLL